MPRIIIEAVEPKAMRAPYNKSVDVAGDWFVNEHRDLVIRVVGVDPFRQNEAFLVALHELVEAKLCASRGIDQEAVDRFDSAYELSRNFGMDCQGEPGDAWSCPYRREHRQACLIEFLMADFLAIPGYGKMR